MTPMILPARRPARERSDPRPDSASAACGGRGPQTPGAFELADGMVLTWLRNERRLGELNRLDAGVAAARRRLATAAAGRALVAAHLSRLLARRADLVAAARADAESAEAAFREWDDRRVVRRAMGS